jgi:hypothetical protein
MIYRYIYIIYIYTLAEIYVMLHMVSGVVALVVSSFAAHVNQNSDQSKHWTKTKVEDISALTPNHKVRVKTKSRKDRCVCLRSEIFLNRCGFFSSFILILSANCLLIAAKLVSTDCDHLLWKKLWLLYLTVVWIFVSAQYGDCQWISIYMYSIKQHYCTLNTCAFYSSLK